MTLPIEALVGPVVDHPPCGEDPADHDVVYQELQQKILGHTDYKLVGDDEVQIYHPPVWQAIYDESLKCAARTRDLRVCIMLIRGAAGCDGLSGLAEGLRLLRETSVRFWDDLHPALDPSAEDPVDSAFKRVSALNELINPRGLLRDLHDIPILEARGVGSFSLRAIRLAQGKDSPRPGEAVPEAGLVKAGMEQDAGWSDTLAVIGDVRNELKQLGGELNMRLGSEAPDLASIDKILVEMAEIIGNEQSDASTPAATTDQKTLGSAPSVHARAGNSEVNGLSSREQVTAALDHILNYYQQYEPASPIPVLLKAGYDAWCLWGTSN